MSYKYYSLVFKKDFPKLEFHRPRVDTCNTCDKLSCEIHAKVAGSKGKLELHHRKVEKALKTMKEDIATSQEPGSTTSCLSMDLQQVLFVPTLTHSSVLPYRAIILVCISLTLTQHSCACSTRALQEGVSMK